MGDNFVVNFAPLSEKGFTLKGKILLRYNGDNFCDFLFSFQYTKILSKRDLL